MEKLNEIINEAMDAREVKRALCVKMRLTEIETKQICTLLNVSPQYVSKWSGIYETQGAASLKVSYVGSEGYLSDEARQKTVAWIQEHETISVEALRDYLETEYAVIYQSKQSYYDLLAVAGMSYHKTEKKNPNHDEAQVLTRRAEIKKNWSTTKKRWSPAK
jgi:putative transposase